MARKKEKTLKEKIVWSSKAIDYLLLLASVVVILLFLSLFR